MKSVRLLPVVIFAAVALLLFKGIGLVTNGGYVLTGPTVVQAAGHGEAPAGDGGVATEPTLTDTSPVLEDDAPTLATKAEAPAHGATVAAEPATASGETHASPASASAESVPAATVECPAIGEASSADAAAGCAPSATPVNAHGDALPLTRDANGQVVALQAAEGDSSEDALLGRLSERRAELDRRAADIDMRTALLEAAEKRLDQRAQELAALEAKVAALVDQKQAAEEEGFKAVVSMYEGMKPKDAAKIFDTLSMPVLLKVARAMSPRKMSPILAAMSADPAQKLTTAMAATENTAVVTANAGENLATLPQIVGQ